MKNFKTLQKFFRRSVLRDIYSKQTSENDVGPLLNNQTFKHFHRLSGLFVIVFARCRYTHINERSLIHIADSRTSEWCRHPSLLWSRVKTLYSIFEDSLLSAIHNFSGLHLENVCYRFSDCEKPPWERASCV